MAADEIKKCSVRIGGVYYQLVTAENEQYTRKIAARADEMINRFLQDNPQLSQTMATVLALVNAVDELSRAYQQLKGMEGQHLDLDSKASEARRELNRLREQHWEMKKELLRITDLNRDYQTLINKLTQAEAQNAPAVSVNRQSTSQMEEHPPDKGKLPPTELQPSSSAEKQPVPPAEDNTASSAEKQPVTPAEDNTASSAEKQPVPPAEEQSASSAENQPTSTTEEQPVASAEEQPSPPEDKQPAIYPESSMAGLQDLADLEANQSVPTDDQPDPASKMVTEDEQVPEQMPIDLPTDLPDPNRRTIDRLQQTNLDDYLHAFGLNEKSRDTAQSDR